MRTKNHLFDHYPMREAERGPAPSPTPPIGWVAEPDWSSDSLPWGEIVHTTMEDTKSDDIHEGPPRPYTSRPVPR